MILDREILIPDLGTVGPDSGFHLLSQTEDGRFVKGKNGVEEIVSTGDEKVEFVSFGDKTLACVKSAIAYPVYYPVQPVKLEMPVKAVLMDLDGTTVRSEEFWIWIIQMSIASLLGNPKFELEDADMPFVSGHSVSEHLQYCIDKYCPGASLDKARDFYFEHTHREMEEIMAGCGTKGAEETAKTGETETATEVQEVADTEKDTDTEPVIEQMTFPLPDGPEEAEIYVEPVEGISDDFICGMDASAVLSVENSGATYYNYDGEE